MAVERLIKLLNDENPFVCFEAASALAKIKDARAIEPLIKALGSSKLYTAEEAAKSLVVFGKVALEPLKTALKDEKNEAVKVRLNKIIDAITNQ